MSCVGVVQVVPPWALPLLALSKRMHSIFVLRLFNDCIAMLLAYVATGVAPLPFNAYLLPACMPIHASFMTDLVIANLSHACLFDLLSILFCRLAGGRAMASRNCHVQCCGICQDECPSDGTISAHCASEVVSPYPAPAKWSVSMQHFALKGDAHASVASASCLECTFLEARLHCIPVLHKRWNFLLF